MQPLPIILGLGLALASHVLLQSNRGPAIPAIVLLYLGATGSGLIPLSPLPLYIFHAAYVSLVFDINAGCFLRPVEEHV